MCASQNPTILFVHGAWHRPKHFERVSNLLNEQGFPTSRPANASVGGSKTANMHDDANVVRAELNSLIVDDQKEVIVVMHSYGGLVGTQAVDSSLSKRSRQAEGLPGGVLRLVYMAAFMLDLGKPVIAPVDGELPPAFGAKDGFVTPSMPEKLLYHDLNDDDKAYFISILELQTTKAFITPLTYVAWKEHPVSYIFCTDDRILPLSKQQSMVAESGIESEVERFEVDTSHSPFLSKPQLIVNVIKKIADHSQDS